MKSPQSEYRGVYFCLMRNNSVFCRLFPQSAGHEPLRAYRFSRVIKRDITTVHCKANCTSIDPCCQILQIHLWILSFPFVGHFIHRDFAF